MSFDDWMLALHVLSAFAWVAGIVLFWILIVAVRRTDTPEGTIRTEPVVKVGNAAIGIGMVGTIVFGIWLAFSVGDYDIWDGWIIAALVLWVISMPLGQRTGAIYTQGMDKAHELRTAGHTGPSRSSSPSTGPLPGSSFTPWSVVVLLILIDMIWKPGA